MGLGPDGVQRCVGRLIDPAVFLLLTHHFLFQPLVMGQPHQFVQRVFAHLGVLDDFLQHFLVIVLHDKNPLVYLRQA